MTEIGEAAITRIVAELMATQLVVVAVEQWFLGSIFRRWLWWRQTERWGI
jgi:hypothetical protein